MALLLLQTSSATIKLHVYNVAFFMKDFYTDCVFYCLSLISENLRKSQLLTLVNLRDSVYNGILTF